jgi:hypothetical protein
VNRARLRELGFELGARAEAGVSDEGAWFATGPDGASVVLKWFPDETVTDRYAVLLPGLDELRSRGVPVCPSVELQFCAAQAWPQRRSPRDEFRVRMESEEL